MKTKALQIVLLTPLALALFVPALAEETVFTGVCGDYEYTVDADGNACITYYTGSTSELTIPDQLDGHPVTAIGGRAFSVCTALTSVTIPDSVTIIENSTFGNCKKLATVTLPDSLMEIGRNAFSNCGKGLTITVPRDSYAAQYYKDNGLNYRYPDSMDWLLN